MPEKVSIGIACVRMTPLGPQILLVRKRHTYAYGMFVNGRYRADNDRSICNMLARMTTEEKITLQSLNFPQIWYSIWMNEPQIGSKYERARFKFNSTFVLDHGARLSYLISQAYVSADLVWEIPKGRRNKNEPAITCAVREFAEETRVQKKQYILRPDHYKYTYTSDGTKYTNIYYFALAVGTFQPQVNVTDPVQACEIGAIQWMGLREIAMVDQHNRITEVASRAFKFIKKNM